MRKKKKVVRRIEPYLYLLPGLIVIIAFIYSPFVKTIVGSTYKVDMFGQLKEFCGLDNYVKLFTNESFYKALGQTFLHTVIFVPFSILIGFVLALIADKKSRFHRVYEVLFCLSMTVSISIACQIFRMMYMKDLDLAVKAQQIFDDGSIGLSADDFQEGMLNSLAYEGEAVGLPFSSSAILFYYNKDAFREAGLDPEKAPQTIEELGEYSKQLTKTEGSEIAQYGFGYAADSWVVASWVGQQDTDGQGYSLFGDNNNGHDGVMTKVVFDENGTMKHFLEVYKAAAETGNFKYKEDDPVNNLSAGNITMTLASSASLTTVMDSVGDKFELGVAALPRVDERIP